MLDEKINLRLNDQGVGNIPHDENMNEHIYSSISALLPVDWPLDWLSAFVSRGV